MGAENVKGRPVERLCVGLVTRMAPEADERDEKGELVPADFGAVVVALIDDVGGALRPPGLVFRTCRYDSSRGTHLTWSWPDVPASREDKNIALMRDELHSQSVRLTEQSAQIEALRVQLEALRGGNGA